MEDAVAGLGRRIVEVSRLAVLMHLEAVLGPAEAEAPAHSRCARPARGEIEGETALVEREAR